jgi:hypothetical protein
VTVIYEVNLCVAEPVADTFADWLPGHVEDMLTLPGFIDAVIAREETGDQESTAWSVRYRLQERQSLDDYLAHHAERMRAEGVERFGKHMQAKRRILWETRQLKAG